MSDVEQREMFRRLCRRFTEVEILPHAHQWEEAGEFPRELYAKAAEVGILGAGYPEAYGGSGGDRLFPLIAAEEMLWSGSTGVVVGLQSHGIALPSIFILGTEAQKQRFVPPIMRGEKIAALAVTEPGLVAMWPVFKQPPCVMVIITFSMVLNYSLRAVSEPIRLSCWRERALRSMGV